MFTILFPLFEHSIECWAYLQTTFKVCKTYFVFQCVVENTKASCSGLWTVRLSNFPLFRSILIYIHCKISIPFSNLQSFPFWSVILEVRVSSSIKLVVLRLRTVYCKTIVSELLLMHLRDLQRVIYRFSCVQILTSTFKDG